MIPPNFKSLIIDMDGVLWKGDTPIGNLPTIFSQIENCGVKVAFATNNGTRTPSQYVDRLHKFGVNIETWQVVTSALGVTHLLKKAIPPGSPVFAIGEQGVMSALIENGYEPLPLEKAGLAQAVIMGLDRNINFEKMREATLLVRSGLPFYATNDDKTFPTPQGEIPGAGAWLSVVVVASGRKPIVAGKPSTYLLDLAMERLGTGARETLIVGDRLETDIAAGQAAHCPTALVLSGVSTTDEASQWDPQPDIVVEDLHHLVF
jgi:4-nitrophenyl phosphatase